jgi:cytochrome c biogenesis protein CcdA
MLSFSFFYKGKEVYIILLTWNQFHLNVFKGILLGFVMRRLLFVFIFLFLVMVVSAVPETEVSYFYSVTCSHCTVVAESGVLDDVGDWENVSVEKYEVSNPVARDKFLKYQKKFGLNGGIPFLVIEQGGGFSYLSGDDSIIDGLGDAIVNFEGAGGGSGFWELTLGVVVVAALIDSVNPCAFGVLLFLMAVLLGMGSSRRALRAGVIYSGVIFLVYFLAGFGIMKLIGGLAVLDKVKVVVGVVVLVGGVIELKDFFWEGRGISLKIPAGARPLLEKYVRKGTLPAIVVLGALVALVELPCTGGIYLAILSLIAESGVSGIFYLVVYNLIFVLPLILITYVIYRGTRVDAVNGWVQRNKRYMRLAAGVIMVLLAVSLFGFL